MYKETVVAFTQLLQQHPQLASKSQRDDLLQRLSSLTTLKELSNALVNWCEKYPGIDKLLVPETTEAIRGPGGTTSSEPSPEEEKKLKEELLNVINNNEPPKDTKKT